MIKMKQLPLSERPYEKLEMYGAEVLSNSELLAIIIKTGTKEDTSVTLAQTILNIKNKPEQQQEQLRSLQEISIHELTKIKGIGKVKAIQILAVCELAKRMSRPINKLNYKIKNTQDVANLLLDELKYEKREKVKALILNNKNIVLKIIDISLGGTNFAILEPKHVLAEAVKLQAPKIILVHNHPSGDPTPSDGDILVTQRLDEAADIMGIELLDHVVIGDSKYESVFSKKYKMKGL